MLGIYIFIGGGIGSLLRHLLNNKITSIVGSNFPYSTCLINITGSFVMGLLVGYFSKSILSMELRAFLTVGLLGGFTTFSAFSLDTVLLLQRGQSLLALAYIGCSVLFSITGVFLGLQITR